MPVAHDQWIVNIQVERQKKTFRTRVRIHGINIAIICPTKSSALCPRRNRNDHKKHEEQTEDWGHSNGLSIRVGRVCRNFCWAARYPKVVGWCCGRRKLQLGVTLPVTSS